MTSIQVGINLSASAAADADPVGDARLAEQAGFDFVSANDHPGGSRPTYETWTLLTWVAAATTRIGVATRVLGVPFRSPPLIAKAAEALDRLSGGRLVLGLGAGSSDPEMASFGLPSRGAGQKIRGLDDAVTIIRGLWEEPVLSYAGDVYRTDHARLEPKPAHPIPIWLGTFGPRGLAVTGRLADGWIPTLGPAAADQLPAMRAQILAAAAAAGRDPAAVTCVLNLQVTLDDNHVSDPDPFTGPPQKIIDGLLGYLGLGFTAFNLTPPETRGRAHIERLATDVLPTVRAARPSTSP
jgi:alkanesulfonate monooxygenase SsuD/methylene tetrahydromethanopterin reductase-like flavin-dependent oxidoreductase (luciferase family)